MRNHTMPPYLAAELRRVVTASMHHLITPEATLHDLQLDPLAVLDLGEAILTATGRELPDAELEAWERVADIITSAEKPHA